MAGPVTGGLNPLRPGSGRDGVCRTLSGLLPAPSQPGVFCRAHGRDLALLPEAGPFAAAAADVRGRAGQPSFCGSQEPLQPGNSGLMLSPGMVPSLTDLSSPGRHDRCWEHMPGINSLRHSRKRERGFLCLLPSPLLSDSNLTKRKIRFPSFLAPNPLHWAFPSLF